MVNISNDEPSLIDGLGRTPYVEALLQVLETAATPLVVGVYGSWGSGKTSLLRQIQHELNNSRGSATVWFDPWEHQFDEHPAIGLVQSVYSHGERGDDDSRRSRLTQIRE